MTAQAAIAGNLHLIQGGQEIIAGMGDDTLISPRGDNGSQPRAMKSISSINLKQEAQKPRYESLYEKHKQNQLKLRQKKEKYE